jgi:hypothetical protein
MHRITASYKKKPKGCTILHTGLIAAVWDQHRPDCPTLGSQQDSTYPKVRTLLPPNKSYQVRLASVKARCSHVHVRDTFITIEGITPVQNITTLPRPPQERGQVLWRISPRTRRRKQVTYL